jgi:hypothetical protein
MPEESRIVYLLLAAVIVAPGAWAAWKRIMKKRDDR